MRDTGRTIRVWDPVVRIGHWTLVIAFFVAYLTEDDFLTQHVWAGYIVGAVICIRLIWGFIGGKHARFSDFVRAPAAAFAYLREVRQHTAPRYLGHNPAGGLMIVALLLTLCATVYSGLMLYAIEEHAGPLANWVVENDSSILLPSLVATAQASEYEGDEQDFGAGAGEEFWEELHEFFANFMLLLIVFHVAGVVYSSYMEKENLAKAMFTGRKRSHGVTTLTGTSTTTAQERSTPLGAE